ncbi:MAG: hypothetical protein M3N42_03830 [Cyanobacteriota bacterium]|nr:hypothetical protein [Cyanobacteriota bacterium]
MSDLFLGKLQKIEIEIEDRMKHIAIAQEHIISLQIQVEERERYKDEVLTCKEVCEATLAQVRTALTMLHRVDADYIPVFENILKKQFRLDFTDLLPSVTPNFVDSVLSTGLFTGIPSPAKFEVSVIPFRSTDGIFDNLACQYQFQVLSAQLSLIGISIGRCFLNESTVKYWVAVWNGDEAVLVWTEKDGWDIDPREEDKNNFFGEWLDFDLEKYLASKGIDLATLG